MPQLTTVVLTDDESTPVAHTFVPQLIKKDGTALLKNSDGTPIGDEQFSVSIRSTGTKYKVRALLTIPQIANEVINGVTVPKVVRTAVAEVNLTFGNESTVQERKNASTMMGDALNGTSAMLASVFHDLEGIY